MIHQPMRLREIEKHAVEMDISLGYAIARRRNFLFWELSHWLNVETDLATWHVLCAPRIWAVFDDLIFLNRDVAWKNKPVRKGEITDEMKQRAKSYPIERLIEFNPQGKAPCFVHGDKTASLHWSKQRNRVHCFGCGKDMDTIDVLMIRDGKNLSEAVRNLCG